MDKDQLLEELTLYERLPEAAIREAMEQRSEMLPVFLQEIETFVADDDPIPEVPTPLLMIVHILGTWREKSAYRPVARLLMVDPERLEWALGDSITETVPRIMLNLFDGDARPLYEIVMHEAADEFVRAGMLRVLATLAQRGDIDRDEVASFLKAAHSSLQPQGENYVWVGWQEAIATLGLVGLRQSVKTAFEDGFIDPDVMSYRHFEFDLERATATDPEDGENSSQLVPFGDTIDELSKWHGFSAESASDRAKYGADDEGATEDLDDLDLMAELATYGDASLDRPAVNPFRDIGRNDPCPCGSGKKFKRCCLDKMI
jgi:hypothetical protein